jgi:L-ribulose-5-phosphate 3-epimerase
MRLGIAGLLPGTIDELNTATARQVREMGFSGVAWNSRIPLATITPDRAREIGRIFADEGVDLVELGQYQTTLVDADASVRRQNVDNLRHALRISRALGCPAVITGAGSLNPKGQWFAHPENHGLAARERLVMGLREATRAAEDEGVILALECHTTTALKDAPTTRAIVEQVDSRALKVHLDPVNWITFDNVFNNGVAIESMFEALGQYLYGAHSKGVLLEDRLIVHLSETVTGAADDLLDHATFLKQLAALPGDPYLVIEHLPVEAMPAARDHVLAVARSVGLSFTR